MTANNEENIFKYTGPSYLRKVEDRLLEIEHEKEARLYNLREDSSGSIEDEIERSDISYLDVEKKQLQLKRQFILDERNGWKAKSIWNIIVPISVSIIVSVITVYVIHII